MRWKRGVGLLVAPLCTLAVAGLCWWLADMGSAWYLALVKPAFWVGEAWFTVAGGGLFLLALIACVWLKAVSLRQCRRDDGTWLSLGACGALWVGWCLIVFRMHGVGFGFFWLLGATVALWMLVRRVWRMYRHAALLFVPWLLAAGYLVAVQYCWIMLN